MVGPEAPQVIFRHRAGGYHMVHRSLEAAGGDGERETEVSTTLAPGWEIGQPPHTPPATTSLGRTSPWGQVLALTNEMLVLAEGLGHRGGQLLFPACLPGPLLSSPAGAGLLSVARRNPWPQEPGQGFRQDAEPAIISVWKRRAGIDGATGPGLSPHLAALSLSWCRLQAAGPAAGTQTPSTQAYTPSPQSVLT